MLFFWTFLIKEYWKKCIKASTKILSNTTDFNVYHDIMFLEDKIILEWFLNDHVTQKAGVMAPENSGLSSEEYITFKHILKQKTVVLNSNISQYYSCTVFLIK